MPMGGLLPYLPLDPAAAQPQSLDADTIPVYEDDEARARIAQDQYDADHQRYIPAGGVEHQGPPAGSSDQSYTERLVNAAKAAMAGKAPAATPPPGPDKHKVTDAPAYPEVQATHGAATDETKAQNDEDETRRALLSAGIGMLGTPKVGQVVTPSGHAFFPMGGKDKADRVLDTTKDAAQSARVLEQIQKAELVEQEDFLVRSRQEMDAKYAADTYARQQEQAEIKSRLDNINLQAGQIAKHQYDKGRIFKNPAGAIGAIAAIFMPLFSKDPSEGARIIDQQIQRDLDLQMHEMQMGKQNVKDQMGLLHEYMALTNNMEQARMMAESHMKGAAAMKLQELSLRYKGQKLGPQTEMIIGQLNQEANDISMKNNLLAYREFQKMTPGQQRMLDKMAQENGAPGFFEKPIGNQGTGTRLKGEADQIMAGFQTQLDQPDTFKRIERGEMPPEEVAKVVSKAGIKPEHSQAVAKASAAIVNVKNPGLSQQLKDKGLDVSVHDLAQTVMPEYLLKHTKKGVTDFDAARNEFITDIQNAANKGVPKIEEALKEDTASVQALAQARNLMSQYKAELGPGAEDAFRQGILFKQGDPTEEVWQDLKRRNGWNDKQLNAARQVRQAVAMARDVASKPIYGAITGSDKASRDQIINQNMSLGETMHGMDLFSSSLEAKVANGTGQGDPIARLLYRSRRRSQVKPADQPGVRKQ